MLLVILSILKVLVGLSMLKIVSHHFILITVVCEIYKSLFFKEDDDFDVPKSKNKHHDRTTWRLLRSEQKEKYGK